jgi:hypothetical protein
VTKDRVCKLKWKKESHNDFSPCQENGAGDFCGARDLLVEQYTLHAKLSGVNRTRIGARTDAMKRRKERTGRPCENSAMKLLPDGDTNPPV